MWHKLTNLCQLTQINLVVPLILAPPPLPNLLPVSYLLESKVRFIFPFQHGKEMPSPWIQGRRGRRQMAAAAPTSTPKLGWGWNWNHSSLCFPPLPTPTLPHQPLPPPSHLLSVTAPAYSGLGHGAHGSSSPGPAMQQQQSWPQLQHPGVGIAAVWLSQSQCFYVFCAPGPNRATIKTDSMQQWGRLQGAQAPGDIGTEGQARSGEGETVDAGTMGGRQHGGQVVERRGAKR